MSITEVQAKELLAHHATVWTSADQHVGQLERIFTNPATGQPTWMLVLTDQVHPEALVPLYGSYVEAGVVVVPYPRSSIDTVPHFPTGRTLTAAQTRRLEAHYDHDQRMLDTAPDVPSADPVNQPDELTDEQADAVLLDLGPAAADPLR